MLFDAFNQIERMQMSGKPAGGGLKKGRQTYANH
jgi:hypothetical protein